MNTFQGSFLFPKFKTKAFTLSYDDGSKHDIKMVEMLNEYNVKCTFNLNSGSLDSPYNVCSDQIVELYRGHEIACHTHNHPFLEHLSPASASYQILKDREILEGISNIPIQGMAYPYGLDPERLPQSLLKQCGIHYSRTTKATHNFSIPTDFIRWNPTCHHNDGDFNELAEKFNAPIENPKWPYLFYVWGHSYEFDGKWEILENMLEKVSGSDDVWYATNGEIYDYISAYYALEHSVDGKHIKNPTATDVFVRYRDVKVIIPAGKTVTLNF
jgi:peptidoglycan/xylan/chitin deacetylase (PgdA/CDA1 family)